MADAVTVLREEIAILEGEINKRRQALTILSGAATPTKSLAAKSPVAKNPAVKRLAAKHPAPRPSTPAGPSLAERIVAHLSSNKGKLFTPPQVTEELAKTDKSVKRENVQRRLSDLFNRKQIKREDGRYGVA
jgi:hypothetical protein